MSAIASAALGGVGAAASWPELPRSCASTRLVDRTPPAAHLLTRCAADRCAGAPIHLTNTMCDGARGWCYVHNGDTTKTFYAARVACQDVGGDTVWWV